MIKKLKLRNDYSLKEFCLSFEKKLNHDMFYDIDGLKLFYELKVLKEIIPN